MEHYVVGRKVPQEWTDTIQFLEKINAIGKSLKIRGFSTKVEGGFLHLTACGQKNTYTMENKLIIVEAIMKSYAFSKDATLFKYAQMLQNFDLNYLAQTLLLKYNFKLPARGDSERKKIVGGITVYPFRLIGEGSNATKVFLGTFGRRLVAVKRVCVLTKNERAIMREVDCLLECDNHHNIVKYYGVEEIVTKDNEHFIYLALELCDLTLAQWVASKGELAPDITQVEVLHQCTTGVNHLHRNRIIHRDLKPENILLVRISVSEVRVKISDFGISRKIAGSKSTFTVSTMSGTSSWMAPELLQIIAGSGYDGNLPLKMTRASDIFSIGCLYFYVLSFGDHPFGNHPIMIPANILCNNWKDIVNLTKFDLLHLGSFRLISQMLDKRPDSRPSTVAILKHHMFWRNEKKLQFLVAISNTFEKRYHEANVQECLEGLEESAIAKLYTFNTSGWLSSLCSTVQDHLKKTCHRTYYGDTIFELIRCIRNLHNHYAELPIIVRQKLGTPDENLNYWMTRFPFLIDLVWTRMGKLRGDPYFGIGIFYSDCFCLGIPNKVKLDKVDELICTLYYNEHPFVAYLKHQDFQHL